MMAKKKKVTQEELNWFDVRWFEVGYLAGLNLAYGFNLAAKGRKQFEKRLEREILAAQKVVSTHFDAIFMKRFRTPVSQETACGIRFRECKK